MEAVDANMPDPQASQKRHRRSRTPSDHIGNEVGDTVGDEGGDSVGTEAGDLSALEAENMSAKS